MIGIRGSVLRTFIFPARLPEALAFYANFDRTLTYLTHISKVKQYSPLEVRALYHTMELGVYRVRMYCDLQVQLRPDENLLSIRPLPGYPPVKSEASLYALTAQGEFASDSRFHDRGDETAIDYHLRLRADLPTPLAFRVVPGPLADRIAESIMHHRMYEIADGFIERSIAAYQTLRRSGSEIAQ